MNHAEKGLMIVDGLRYIIVEADGYLTKPFSGNMLVAQLRALQRRGEMGRRRVLQFVDVEMDLTSREVHRGGRPIRLTNLEFKLLAALVKRAGQVASTEVLMREVWGVDFDPGTGLVKVHLSRVRRKLEAGGAPRIIESVPRQGYRMVGRSVGLPVEGSLELTPLREVVGTH